MPTLRVLILDLGNKSRGGSLPVHFCFLLTIGCIRDDVFMATPLSGQSTNIKNKVCIPDSLLVWHTHCSTGPLTTTTDSALLCPQGTTENQTRDKVNYKGFYLQWIQTLNMYDLIFINSSIFIKIHISLWGFPGGTSDKEPACQRRRCKRHRFNPWVRKIPWSRARQPTPVFLPGESHGQTSLAGYSP